MTTVGNVRQGTVAATASPGGAFAPPADKFAPQPNSVTDARGRTLTLRELTLLQETI